MAGGVAKTLAKVVGAIAALAIVAFAFYPMIGGDETGRDAVDAVVEREKPRREDARHPTDEWREGVHYERVPNPEPLPEDGTIEVTYSFWYGCPGCYNLEPHIVEWAQDLPEDVRLTRVAASMNPGWEPHARAYYTAEVLGVVDDVHRPLYDAIHVEGRRLESASEIAEVFTAHGVDEEDFFRAFESFAVETRLRRADQVVRRYRLTGVPSIVVGGRYRTASAATFAQLVELVDHLVEQVRAR